MSDLIPSPTVSLVDGKPMVNSRDIALRFQRKHAHILADIRRIQSMVPKLFYESNFRSVAYADPKGEERPAYKLTRDAFSLLAMGFTGKAAILWKLQYIEAFNALEQAALDGMRAQIALARSEGAAVAYRLGPARRRRMRRAMEYRAKGLSIRDIAKLLDKNGREISNLLKAARILGLEAPHAAVR